MVTFSGKYNASKTKALMVLYYRKHNGIATGLNVRDIHLQSGVSYGYLRSRLRKWHAWGYLSRKPIGTNIGRPVYHYTITHRGQHFIEDIVPRARLSQYAEDINDFQGQTL
tara:strand:- start:141 stop:473 length:333 start_codon:yes stop_codon:yes gene_type:complete